MTNVAILGYGNLGKAVEIELLKEQNICLVGIFSRRKNPSSPFGCAIYDRKDLINFVHKVDVLVLCTGSQSSIESDVCQYAQHFCTINTFDNHAKIPQLFEKLNAICIKNQTLSILSCGWDPGLFSCYRATCWQILQTMPTCFWGKGISLGHSQAVRNISGVVDAVSYTLPNKIARYRAKKGLQSKNLHFRKVYVESADPKLNKQIKQKIKNMPHYFAGQKVKIKFICGEKLRSLKKFFHKGEVIASDNENRMSFMVSMDSNPAFTAKIILTYLRVFQKLKNKYKFGAYTPLHFSPMDLSNMDEIETIIKFC